MSTKQDNDRKSEISRVLSCTKIDFFAILNLPVDFSDDDVKKQYKTLSLLLHPDKAPEGFLERAQVAFTVLNAAKEAMDTPDKIKHWQSVVQTAVDQVVKERIVEFTKIKQEQAKLANMSNWAALTVTSDEVKKRPEFQSWVNLRVKDTLITEDWQKKQLMKRREMDINELREEEEAKMRKQTATVKVDDELEKNVNERANNWQSFQMNRGGLRSTAVVRGGGINRMRGGNTNTNRTAFNNRLQQSNVGMVQQAQSLTKQFQDGEKATAPSSINKSEF